MIDGTFTCWKCKRKVPELETKCLPGIGMQCLDKVDCKAASSSASALCAELAAANAREEKAEAQLGIAVKALGNVCEICSAHLTLVGRIADDALGAIAAVKGGGT